MFLLLFRLPDVLLVIVRINTHKMFDVYMYIIAESEGKGS